MPAALSAKKAPPPSKALKLAKSAGKSAIASAAAAGKGSKPSQKKSKAAVEPEPLSDEDDSEAGDEDFEFEDYDDGKEDSEDSDSDEEDVSPEGLQRLMDALGEDGLSEQDRLALAALQGGDDEDEDDEDEEDFEEDDEDDSEEEEDDQDMEAAATTSNGAAKDTLAASLLRSGLIPQAEDDEDDDDEEEEDEDEEDEDPDASTAIPLDSLTDEAFSSLPDAVRSSRFHREKINNHAALTAVRQAIALDPPKEKKMDWIEHMSVTWDQSAEADLAAQGASSEDDLKRELSFYKQAMHAAVLGRQRVLTAGVPFSRPSDYFAEMVKSDAHMERMRQTLLDERAGIKASEEAKRQRELKKVGKKVQVERTLERQRDKKEMAEKLQGLKRKRGTLDTSAGQEGGGDDDDLFDVRLENALDSSKRSRGEDGGRGRGRGARGGARMPRSARDEKYGHGGKKRHSKSNDKKSTEGGYGQYKEESSRGGRGGGRGGRGGRGGSRGGMRGGRGGAAKRPGKSKRQ